MAIAMRERLHDLKHVWRDAGVEMMGRAFLYMYARARYGVLLGI